MSYGDKPEPVVKATGVKAKPDALGQAFVNGIVDRVEYGLLRKEQLYRRTRLHRWAWRAGWELANALTTKPLRTAKKVQRAS